MRFCFDSNDLASQPVFYPNRWYHVVYVATADHSRQIYVNGVLMASAASTGGYFGIGGATIGTYAYSTSRRFRGLIDEFMIFDRALERTQVELIFQSAPTPASQTTCNGVYANGLYPTGFYSGLTDETQGISGLTFCRQGKAVAPFPFLVTRSSVTLGPLFYYSFDVDLNDVVNKNSGTKQGSGVSITPLGKVNNGASFPTTAGSYIELSFMPQTFFTGSWTFALWVSVAGAGRGFKEERGDCE